NTSQTMVTGMNTFQPRRMIWSKRKRGNVARIHRNMNSTHSTLARSQTNPGMAERIGVSSGAAQPPKNMMVVRNDTKIMLAYSAMENTPNSMPEYSTWKPMISDSPSAMS